MSELRPYNYELTISKDGYKAHISIELIDDQYELSRKDIDGILAEKNVTYGIKEENIERILQNPKLASSMLIAEGKPHEDGVDAEIIFHVDKDKNLKPKYLEDGSVDYKNIDFFQTISVGDTIATKIKPTEGIDGMSVTGKVVKGKPGKDVVFKFGKNVSISSDGMRLISDAMGTVKFDGERVMVVKILEIKGDVGVTTGNVIFPGKIIIMGNVNSGFKVIAEDDVEIYGLVEGAEIYAKGSIKINKGVQGNDHAVLRASKDIEANFINSTHLHADGNIKANAIMHCKTTCNGEVVVSGRKGMLVGGELSARKDVKATTVGSEMGTTTIINIGLDPSIIERYKSIKEETTEIKKNVKKLDQAISMIIKQKEAGVANPKLEEMLEKSRSSRHDYVKALDDKNKESETLSSLMDSLKDSKLYGDKIYPGVRLKIGTVYYNVKSLIENAVLQKEGADIVIRART